jgi:hypothetical protein
LINGEHERRWSVDLRLGITDKPLNSQHSAAWSSGAWELISYALDQRI